jgi:hypothetical protein
MVTVITTECVTFKFNFRTVQPTTVTVTMIVNGFDPSLGHHNGSAARLRVNDLDNLKTPVYIGLVLVLQGISTQPHQLVVVDRDSGSLAEMT